MNLKSVEHNLRQIASHAQEAGFENAVMIVDHAVGVMLTLVEDNIRHQKVMDFLKRWTGETARFVELQSPTALIDQSQAEDFTSKLRHPAFSLPRGARLRGWLHEQRVHVADVAQAAGVSVMTAYDTIRGPRRNESVVKVLTELGCPADLLDSSQA